MSVDQMFQNLETVSERYDEIGQAMLRPGLTGAELTKMSKERAEIEDIVLTYRSYREVMQARDEAKEMLGDKDAEMRAMAKEELTSAEARLAELEKQLILLTLPRDPNDNRNVILEIRAGTGGDEAALFVGDLLRMYMRYAETVGWKVEMLSSAESDLGGYREVILLVQGDRVYSRLKFESGAHRVQRVPATEAQGRIHTSACTVAVLPEAEEVEVQINPADLEITKCRASGAGGQHVNKTDSAVRIVHLPTGIAVECQDERSQHKNKEKAMKVLKSRLYDKYQSEQDQSIRADRKSQVGSGDRSERIRTYNFPQGRVTDHRINLTLYNLADVMEGDLTKILDGLGTAHQTELLQQQGRTL